MIRGKFRAVGSLTFTLAFIHAWLQLDIPLRNQ